MRCGELERICRELGLAGPDVTRVIRRFRVGADLGLEGPVSPRFSANNKSADIHAEKVTAAVRAEVAEGVTRGPFHTPPLPGLRVNPISARVKPNGKARVILDLSAPHGDAVNELINPDECRVKYASLDELAQLIFAHGGAGTRVFKADVRAAFKLIPVRPDQHAALGFCWAGHFYYQTALPFGCRASPRIFNEFAELLRDLVRVMAGNQAVLNYLDDFFGVEPTDAVVSTFQCFQLLCERIGVPLAPGKSVAPATRVEILGIIVNTERMTYELPDRKLVELLTCLRDLAGKRRVTRRQLLSVAGRLAHACKCVPLWRWQRLIFAARMREEGSRQRGIDHYQPNKGSHVSGRAGRQHGNLNGQLIGAPIRSVEGTSSGGGAAETGK